MIAWILIILKLLAEVLPLFFGAGHQSRVDALNKLQK